jgi:hypothetical protein
MAVFAQTGPTGVLQLQSHSKPWAAGASGLVNINLVIKEGFKIPKRPLPKIQIDPASDFEIKGALNFVEEGQGNDPDYFNSFKPLVIQVRATDATKPGRYSLGGKFVYFYCSNKEKYCSRAIESVQIPIEILAKK